MVRDTWSNATTRASPKEDGPLRLSRSPRLAALRLAKHRALPRSGKTRPLGEADVAEKKGQRRSGDKRVIFRRDGKRYIVFLGDDRIGFVQRTDNGSWNHVDMTMAHSGYAKTRERAGQLLLRRYERMVREGVT